MSTFGGNWKDLVKAACEGNVALAKYHLEHSGGGVDPNFQHPEYLTTDNTIN